MNLLLPILFCSVSVYSQEVGHLTAVWQRAHPDVLFIQDNDYYNLTEEQKDLLGSNFILFSDEITLEDIKKYEKRNKGKADLAFIVSSESEKKVKTWLFNHPNVKIISRSEFQSFPEERQKKYVLLNSLILENDILTLNDIENYESKQ